MDELNTSSKENQTSDGKINITWDELNSARQSPANPVYTPPQQGGSFSQPRYSSVPPASKDYTPWLVSGIIVAIVVIGLLFVAIKAGTGPGTSGQTSKELVEEKPQTVEEWCQDARVDLNRELAKASSPFRKRIEDAHLTVDVRYAIVKYLVAETLDGSDYSKDGDNIACVTFQIEFTWDGFFHKGGTTVLEVKYDLQNKQTISAEIIATDALINTEDPAFWFGVGWEIGKILAL